MATAPAAEEDGEGGEVNAERGSRNAEYWFLYLFKFFTFLLFNPFTIFFKEGEATKRRLKKEDAAEGPGPVGRRGDWLSGAL